MLLLWNHMGNQFQNKPSCARYINHTDRLLGREEDLLAHRNLIDTSAYFSCIILLFVTECQIVYIHLEYDSSTYSANALMFFCQCFYKFSVEIKFMAITQSMAITQGTSSVCSGLQISFSPIVVTIVS